MENSTNAEVHILGFYKSTLAYFGGFLLSNALTLMTLPILAGGLSKGEFGLLDLYMSVGILVTVTLAFGMDSSVGRLLSEFKEDGARRRLILESLLFQSISIVAIVLTLYWIAPSIIAFFGEDSAYILPFRLVVVQSGFQAFLNISLNLLKWTFQKWKFIFLSTVSAISGLIFIWISIYIFNPNIVNVLLAISASRLLSALVGFYLISNFISFEIPRLYYMGRILRYALPIGIICVLDVTLPVIERNSIFKFLSTEELGQYAAAARFIAILAVVVQAFQSAWGPFSLSVMHDEKVGESFEFTAKIYVITICLISLSTVMFGKVILFYLFSEAYQNGYILIFPMAMSLVIQSIGSITGIGIIISNRPYFQLLNYGLFIFVGYVLIGAFTEQYGILGTASALLITNTLRTIVISWAAQCFFYIRWPFKVISAIVVLSLIIGIFLILLLESFGYIYAGIFFLLSITILSCGFWFYALDDEEKVVLRAMSLSRSLDKLIQ